MQIGHVLKAWRTKEGLTLVDVSVMLDITLPTLHRIENGAKMDGVPLAKILRWLLKD